MTLPAEAKDLPGYSPATGRAEFTQKLAKSGPYAPMIFNAALTAGAATGSTVTVLTAPQPLKIVEAYMHARDTTASNVTLKVGSDALTAATAKGTADDTRVQFAALIAEYDELDAGETLDALFSAASVAVDVTVVAIPV